MPFVAIDHTIAFAIDAPSKASDMQQLDQNVDDVNSRLATVEGNYVSNAHDHVGGDGALITLSALKLAQGSYNTTSFGVDVYIAVHRYAHLTDLTLGPSSSGNIWRLDASTEVISIVGTVGPEREIRLVHTYNAGAPYDATAKWDYHSN